MKTMMLCALAVTAPLFLGCAPTNIRAPSNLADAQIAARFLDYRDFRVDLEVIRKYQDRTAIIDSVRRQVDIVADCHVSEGVQKFFRSQDIGLQKTIEHGAAKHNRIYLAAVVDSPQKPVLLHEMMHIFHARMLPNGEQNSDVIHFFKIAKEAKLYRSDAYLLTNEREFFAMTASVFLHGSADREPLTRERLQRLQPQYYAWLISVFGPRT